MKNTRQSKRKVFLITFVAYFIMLSACAWFTVCNQSQPSSDAHLQYAFFDRLGCSAGEAGFTLLVLPILFFPLFIIGLFSLFTGIVPNSGAENFTLPFAFVMSVISLPFFLCFLALFTMVHRIIYGTFPRMRLPRKQSKNSARLKPIS